MNKVLGCIDTRGNTDAVIDWAAWAALRLGAPLEYLHVLERQRDPAAVTDFSGAIGVDAQASLLEELSQADAQRSREQREAGRELLAHARARASAAGVGQIDARLRHGDFIATAIELQAEVGLFVLGEHYHLGAEARARTDHHLEQVIRGVEGPVLVATADSFEPPQRVVIAFDGSRAARKALAGVARHPLLAGMPMDLVRAGVDTAEVRRELETAQATLTAAGIQAGAQLLIGDPQQVLPDAVKARGPALLVMGAFGHSRLRQWLLGSTTTTLLRRSDVPVLILR